MWLFLDLPLDLVREMRRKAVREARRLSEVAEECLRSGLSPEPLTGPEFPHPLEVASPDMTLGEALHLAKL